MPKLAERLTDVKIKNTKAKEKPCKLAAGRGLHLLVKTDGSKHWQFRFRFDGKENTIAIGRYPEVSLANAEKQATSALELLANGINPSENKKAAIASKTGALANSFEVVAREWQLVISPIKQHHIKIAL
ncbi:MAG: Arm DNA-binding domain-containing protein [Methylotenera sp.]|uniref:Arm DNA-binding domain-containing protein n=1 Tax=Methylotenera sp. TaxID=2051956 RepID=UPI002716D6C9|nr:Arm DNA-binding domain-containing protein [Methylotenera sp.]MDO9393196.1 Arm DNA-binding domain-containing protein [Methylotenera sp.]MDP1522716.1 Arm DNA-binding domain-containing protein [Methylotenera sp.]MDP3308332.1 Arm DNA-binding domain-containing protein [Methylotenera sp.]MDZ4212310.1 Arm DNA-binding domain-containing protein [Methylotenera sp.]